METTYDNFVRLLTQTLPNAGKVVYQYDPLYLKNVERISASGSSLYVHNYGMYDLDGNIQSENLIGSLGSITFRYDGKGRKKTIESPYFFQENIYDPVDNLIQTQIDDRMSAYTYDALSQITSENKSEFTLSYSYDSLYNRTSKNGIQASCNDLNELRTLGNIQFKYDLNGNQILKQGLSETFQYSYDPLNQLTSATNEQTLVNFTYDPLGRRLTKIAYSKNENKWKEASYENYLYSGQNEIGAYTRDNKPKNLRILGLAHNTNCPSSIAIELENKPYAPILDTQGSICRLVDPLSKEIECRYFYSAFGEELQKNIDKGQSNPWRFASKRLDPELNIIYFGKRYYDPMLAKWLTTDPAGFADGVNLYQYVYNNPFRYLDPDGQYAFLIPLLIWSVEVALPAITPIVVNLSYTAIALSTAYWGYKGVEALNRQGSSGTSTPWDLPRTGSNTFSKASEKEEKNKPRFDGKELGDDPSISPGEGFEWKGKDPPGGKRGSWYNEATGEALHPDLNHAQPKKPHWDYTSPDYPKGARLNIDGTWEQKS